MDTFTPFGLLSIPIIGNLFSATVSELSFSKKVVTVGPITYNQYISLNIGETEEIPSGTIRKVTKTHHKRDTSKNTQSARYDTKQGNTSSTFEITEENPTTVVAPCAVYTKMIFDDDRIKDFGTLNLGAIPLIVFGSEATLFEFDEYPHIELVKLDGQITLQYNADWTYSPKISRYKNLTEYRSQEIRIRPMVAISQAHNSRYTITLYRAPVGRTMTIGGQDCIFTKQIFSDVFVLILRSHRKKGQIFVRKVAVVVLPK